MTVTKKKTVKKKVKKTKILHGKQAIAAIEKKEKESYHIKNVE